MLYQKLVAIHLILCYPIYCLHVFCCLFGKDNEPEISSNHELLKQRKKQSFFNYLQTSTGRRWPTTWKMKQKSSCYEDRLFGAEMRGGLGMETVENYAFEICFTIKIKIARIYCILSTFPNLCGAFWSNLRFINLWVSFDPFKPKRNEQHWIIYSNKLPKIF